MGVDSSTRVSTDRLTMSPSDVFSVMELNTIIPLHAHHSRGMPFPLRLYNTNRAGPHHTNMTNFTTRRLPPPRKSVTRLCPRDTHRYGTLQVRIHHQSNVTPNTRSNARNLVLRHDPRRPNRVPRNKSVLQIIRTNKITRINKARHRLYHLLIRRLRGNFLQATRFPHRHLTTLHTKKRRHAMWRIPRNNHLAKPGPHRQYTLNPRFQRSILQRHRQLFRI